MKERKPAAKAETLRHWSMTARQSLAALGSSAEGLSEADAAARREKYGANELIKRKKRGAAALVFAQLKDVSAIVLLIAGALSLAMAIVAWEGARSLIEPIVVFAVVALNIALAVSRERSAENALDALKSLSAPVCRVLREGRPVEMPAERLVPGDVVLLRAGDLVPADARLLTAESFAVDESSLTGESVPAEKDPNALCADDAPLGDRTNAVFSGCLVTAGSASAVVVATGMDTETGKIAAHLADGGRRKTTLQTRLDKVGKVVSGVALISAAVLFAVGMARGQSAVELLVAAVTLAVAAVPETLSLIVTLILTQGAKNMAAKGALVRQMQAVETLGSTSVICSDKTGTLTMNRMTVKRIWTAGGAATGADDAGEEYGDFLEKLCLACAAETGTDEKGGRRIMGDPTETAIVRFAEAKGVDYATLKKEREKVAEVPFSSARKMMTSIYRLKSGGYLVLTKGALDRLPLAGGGAEAEAVAAHDAFASEAMRVIALAGKYTDVLPAAAEEAECGLTLFGLVGIIDPPRPDAAAAIAKAKAAGVRTVMITGDHVATASAIARELGILAADGEAISGRELAALSDDELRENVARYSVYARVSPEDKLRIVRAWQARGEVVAMTGDGVNDAPALKAADVGVAMGRGGTEVARSASEIVLTNDDFSTIVAAVEEGRNIFSCIRKLVYFLLACNLSEIAVMLIAQFIGWQPLPLTPLMLLVVNLFGDGIPGLALAKERSDARIMKRKPIARDESFFSGGLTEVIIRQTAAFTLVTLAAYYIGSHFTFGEAGPSAAAGATMAFLVTGWTSVLHVLTVRSRSMLFRYRVKDNPQLYISCAAMLACIAGTALLGMVPAAGEALGMTALHPLQWLIAAGLSLVPLLVAEYGKLWDLVRTRNEEKTRVG